jgi:hypothetical protein
LELEKSLDLSNTRFLQNAGGHGTNDTGGDCLVNLDEWSVEFDQEEDYNPAELAGAFFE